ncbi:endonuclease/exonuclease/phosphatase family protein [Candidatus Sumerlaeota bacterium]|nr:endonuclease/exonuclease/phosphatase family protein [Candidatus Sumerlaeota bacterium]
MCRRLMPIGLSLTLLSALCVHAFDPAAGDLARTNPDDIRVLSYNVLNNFVSDDSVSPELERIFTALDPDIVLMQEITPAVTTAEIEARLNSYFPSDTWSVFLGVPDGGGDRNALASRYPLSMTIQDTVPASDIRGTTAALIDLPDGTYASDLYVMTAHMKSGTTATDHQERQIHADAIVNWMRDARTAGGNIDLPADTPMLLAGDLNLGSTDRGDLLPYHPTATLSGGDIYDEGTHGADSPPDWDGSATEDAAPYDHNTGDVHTRSSASTDPISRLDRFIFTDSVMRAEGRFILNTLSMSPGALATASLLASDTAIASDHLPCVVDFALGADLSAPGELLVNEFAYDDPGTDDHGFIELINIGGRDLNLQAPVDYQIKRSSNSIPTSDPGSENETDSWDLQGVIPPGGLFVLYNSVGESASIAATIETNLPPLQRQDLFEAFDNFALNNGPDAAFALVIVSRPDQDDTSDSLIEALMYDDTAPGSDNYFRTDTDDDGGNGYLIVLGSDQRSATALSSDTQSFSRNVGSTTPNMFPNNWTIPDVATPGLPNNTMIPVELSVFRTD